MAGLGFTLTTIKYILFFFNFIFVVVGAVILGTGIWVLTDNNATELMHIATIETSDQLVNSGGSLLVAVGVFIFLTAFFGFCGALNQHVCCLLVYASIVGFVLFLQVVAGILGAAFKNKIRNGLEDSMTKAVNDLYGLDNETLTTDSYDFMQLEFKCCGVKNGPSDWNHSFWYNRNQTYPDSCCVHHGNDIKNETRCQSDAANNVTTNEYVYSQGCYSQLHDWVGDHVAALIGVAFGLIFIELFVILSACYLAKAVRNQYEYV